MSGTGSTERPPHSRAITSSPWIVVFAGALVMVVLMVVALSTYRGRTPAADVQTGPQPLLPLLPPSATATPTGAAATSPTPTARPTTPGRPTRSAGAPASNRASTPSPTGVAPATPSLLVSAPPPGQSGMTGRYDVEQKFSGGFIGEVKITNTAKTRQGWTVRLAFSGGRLVTAWVLGPQGTLRETDDGGYTYTSGADLAAGASVRLQFHVERASTSPVDCTVNGTGCTGL
ncbi:cellulose binding domain-containing protein [Micromonospora sp. WMMD812]|uniref:cellulose binding domain-containing protein n=1 Tax=Micromonospora sp. WMMD812 TaxID=3015152 RepID=UPI00248B38A5|nr:cellulose binding domain-containing protein [Micromonospora sp. WMMD812]WBB67454.1 cellulose binding domain-containing protein [Micromonospora sp. WMMD812]